MIPALPELTGHKQVSITNGLHFEHVETIDDLVELSEQFVQQIHHLQGLRVRGDGGEADNVHETNRDTLKLFGLDVGSILEIIGYDSENNRS